MRTLYTPFRPGMHTNAPVHANPEVRSTGQSAIADAELVTQGPTVGFAHHDHKTCVSTALMEAEERCAAAGLRLTPARRRVLEILLEEHRALGAYDVLERMRAEGLGAQPPAAYRALDFLVMHGFAHRIEGLNAFVACAHPGEAHVPAFLHCRACGTVAEAVVEAQSGLLSHAAEETGFAIESTVIEAEGVCPSCRDVSTQDAARIATA